MISETVHKVAGTFIPPRPRNYGPVMAWTLSECLEGRLAVSLKQFCREQVELIDLSRLELTEITDSAIHGCIPCAVADHESSRTFVHEVRFKLDPLSGRCERLD